ncbi:Probable ATP-dependent RNA helicase DDX49 [Strongyloides ratti]|uniref:RNA helicase n=1 Tax=Strongyloides ratti TaxID=34506 RepID=A0A090LCY3_STRRB|nr:Probable ATP-dependent RNA helicase DDX49 [Strongyloides ratti]CEF65988.2 Probable ATP-dependent RNA helicase DDX49 [Strongyloides ratti]
MYNLFTKFTQKLLVILILYKKNGNTVAGMFSEENCGTTNFCYQLLANFLQDPTKINDKLIYIDTSKKFRIDKLTELIKDQNAKSVDSLRRIIVKRIFSIDELHEIIIGLPGFLKHTRVSLMVINSIYGCILSQELIANDYLSSVERILFGLKKLTQQEGIAILTINALVKFENSHEFVPLLGPKWLKQIPKRVSLHKDVYVSNMVRKKVFFSKKYEIGQLNRTIEVVSTVDTKFSDLGLGSWIVNQLKEMQIKKPTPVQINCIPKVLEGVDVLGCSKTGTGKTLAFALPILEKLSVDPYGIYALIITPTRELAFQISDQLIALGKPISLRCSTIVGGRSQNIQANELAKKPHIVVGTPGRIEDHIRSDPNVLDEADQLLDGQYSLQLKSIFLALPKKRQTLLFSATITSALTQLHQVSIHKPYFFEDVDEVKTVDKLTQKYVLCPVGVKDAYLVYVVKNYVEKNEDSSVLIFTYTCKEAQALAIMFNALGFSVSSLHSEISQKDRMSAISKFRNGNVKVLICTDVAARGLDISKVDLVVNHNVPRCTKTYLHRVGRSARAGRFGGALTFVTQYDISLLQAVEEAVGKKLEELKVDDKKVTEYASQVLIMKKEAEIKLEQRNFGERKKINKRKDMIRSGLDDSEVDKVLQDQRKRKKESLKKNNEKKKKISS